MAIEELENKYVELKQFQNHQVVRSGMQAGFVIFSVMTRNASNC